MGFINEIREKHWRNKRIRKDKNIQNTVMIYDPAITDEQIIKWEMPFKRGDSVLYLFEIVNMPGHCAVADVRGKIHWALHTDDFRQATDEEV